MTNAEFRASALAMGEAVEKSHFGKADFRVRNKIFAGFMADGLTYVKLKPEQQEMVCAAEPKVISPIPGGWGRQGWTRIDHGRADKPLLKSLLFMAWSNVAPKSLVKSAAS